MALMLEAEGVSEAPGLPLSSAAAAPVANAAVAASASAKPATNLRKASLMWRTRYAGVWSRRGGLGKSHDRRPETRKSIAQVLKSKSRCLSLAAVRGEC